MGWDGVGESDFVCEGEDGRREMELSYKNIEKKEWVGFWHLCVSFYWLAQCSCEFTYIHKYIPTYTFGFVGLLVYFLSGTYREEMSRNRRE